MTRAQLEKFIRIRNASEFQTNLQFGIDATEAGIDVHELGEPRLEANGWSWKTPFGILIEENGKLRLEAK